MTNDKQQKQWPYVLLIGLVFLCSFAPEATLAAELAEIIRRGKLIVGVKDNLRPLGFYSSEGKLQGRADAFAADNSLLAGWVQEYPHYRQLPVRLSGEPLCVVMPRGLQYANLRERVNRAIADIAKTAWRLPALRYGLRFRYSCSPVYHLTTVGAV